MSAVEVRAARGTDEVAAALALREAVFVGEQGVPLGDELDGRDDAALHLVAVEDGEVVGTCRLLHDGSALRLSRMAVTPECRGRGIAAALLAETDRRAAQLGTERVALAAQLSAVPLYERSGYRAHGEVFEDAGILHRRMEKRRA